MLSDNDISLALASGDLQIEPLDDSQIQPASVDLRLDSVLREPEAAASQVMDNCGYVLQPGRFILGATLEYVGLPGSLAGQLAGKSSLGRRGLQIHCTAGFIDPGFRGNLTLELSNLSGEGFWLRPGMLIAQVCFFRLHTPAGRPYGSPGLFSHYQGQAGPTPAAHLTRPAGSR